MKFKKIPLQYFTTILDRLTRFEPIYIRYKRVFDDIVSKFYIDTDIKTISDDEKNKIAEYIFNNSLNEDNTYDNINNILKDLEEKYFIYNEISDKYLSFKLNIASVIKTLSNIEKLPKNVQYLYYANKNPNLIQNRKKYNLLYPIEKIILCEGQTEFLLLSTIFDLFGYNLDKNGILVIASGGKNQVARKYMQMIEYVKLPFFILLDKDAYPTKEIIDKKLRKNDKIYILNDGEFEDIIPKNVIMNTINYTHSCELKCNLDDFTDNIKMSKNIELIHKKYGFGEYKKAHFAKNLKDYIENNNCISEFQNSEIVNFVNLLKK